jgi:hypothetical protein
MLKRLLLLVSVVTLLVMSVPRKVDAVIGTIDAVPAATLLVPYFEVDLSNPQGVTTLFSVNNSSASAVLAHVTLWSDLGVPTFAFNIYLTGYDVQTINVRDIFNGTVVRTASAGQDPTDTISNKGDLSQDINFASCSGQLPPPALPAEYIVHLQTSHTGAASPLTGGRCSGTRAFDNVARGFITVDTVNNCTLQVASDPGYFSGSTTNQNVLWGDYFQVNPSQNFAQGDTAVHIEASATDPLTTTAGNYTFYGRHVGWTAQDRREPLATSFMARFINGGAFSGGTTFTAWRDSKVNQGTFTCPATFGRPNWYPLNTTNVVMFDEQENPFIVPPPPFFPPPPATTAVPFAAMATRERVAGANLPVPYSFGFAYLNLNHSTPFAGANPPANPDRAQAWVTVQHDADGRYSVGYSANQLSNASGEPAMVLFF